MDFRRIAIPALTLALSAMSAPIARAATPFPAAPAQGYGQRGGWDVPPQQLNALQRQGFHDGIEGARRDFDNHRPFNVENRDEYRHPDLPREQRRAYRDGFRRGYQVGVAHLTGAPGMGAPEVGRPMPPPMRGDWDTIPTEFSAVQQRGFRDGIEGARRDYENHRRPDVNNRDEYRHPDDVPYGMREAYREGFRRGYARAMAHLMGRPWQY
jgi:hypothetical protein